MVAYNMGQYRFGGSSACITALPSGISYKDVFIGEDATSTSFKDFIIVPTEQFSRNQDYYLSLSIPQDMNYEMSFNIKLLKGENTNSSEYQFLKNVSIVRGGSGENVHTVVLYEKKYSYTDQPVIGDDGSIEYERVYDVAAMIPLMYDSTQPSVLDLIYYDELSENYYLGTVDGGYEQTSNYNEISMIASWKQEEGDIYGVFELTFRPVEDGFTQILIEMVRGVEDYNIQRTTEDGTQEYGRKVDISKVKYEVLKVSNLVDYINSGNTLSRIGIWSHPGLTMCINGEEIKVGPSGYYELGSIAIESIGIVAKDYTDNFTLDYQYSNNTVEDE